MNESGSALNLSGTESETVRDRDREAHEADLAKWRRFLVQIFLHGEDPCSPRAEAAEESVPESNESKALNFLKDSSEESQEFKESKLPAPYIRVFEGLGMGAALTAWRGQSIAGYLTQRLLTLWSPLPPSMHSEADSFQLPPWAEQGDIKDKNACNIVVPRTAGASSENYMLDFGPSLRPPFSEMTLTFVGEVSLTITDGSRVAPKGMRLPLGTCEVDGITLYIHVSPHKAFSSSSALCVPAWCVKGGGQRRRRWRCTTTTST